MLFSGGEREYERGVKRRWFGVALGVALGVVCVLWRGENGTVRVGAQESGGGTTAKVSGDGSAAKHGGQLTYCGPKVDRVLFLGNSITLHGPAPAIGWNDNWGMAASAEEKDYVHLVLHAIAQATGSRPQSLVSNIATFERQYGTFDVAAGLRRELEFKPDLVIVAIGENVPALESVEQKHAFRDAVARLLQALKIGSAPRLIVRSCFWPAPDKDAALRAACQEAGGVFVDLEGFGKEAAMQARSEREFAHAGVAGHPGDRGMQAIAAAILRSISAHRPSDSQGPGATP